MSGELRIIPVTGLPEIKEGDDLAQLVVAKVEPEDGDVVVLAQKIVSKSEGRVIALADIEPSERAREIAGSDEDPRRIEVILREAARVVRVRPPLVIAETTHGFICASAGVDASNAPAREMLVLLPEDPDGSAKQIRGRIRELTGREVAVLITDSFGRPWRQGTIDVALGASGLEVMRDLRGTRDGVGYELHSTMIAVADEIASAAELVMGKVDGVPAAVVRGLEVAGDGRARDLVIPEERDLFR
ncbi:MAG: coenzyme F420-0:L-glutamate ligase [Actinomycetota bacterium]|nr:coenzyme F420-0:L-glutamate ligase [Actinomycetota bacterium]